MPASTRRLVVVLSLIAGIPGMGVAQTGALEAHEDATPVDAGTDDTAPMNQEASGHSCAEWVRRVKLVERFKSKDDRPTPSIANIAYGPHPLQTLDVYRPTPGTQTVNAPILVMVHGGGWCVGDKASADVTANKVSRWVAKGFVFVSVNYPMVSDDSDALEQAHHVARAAAFVQKHARAWGGNPDKLILIGHSAGGHLVSLVNADASIRQAEAMRRPLGTIAIDAGAIDVPMQMPRVYRFLQHRYEEAFGTTREQWLAASPFHRLDASASPWLGICSTRRRDDPCQQATAYAEKSQALGVAATVLPRAMSHAELNKGLGLGGPYTRAVEAFMARLDPDVAKRLRQ